jgi:hypothetical protein
MCFATGFHHTAPADGDGACRLSLSVLGKQMVVRRPFACREPHRHPQQWAAVAAVDRPRVHPLTRLFAYALIVAVLVPPLTDTERWPFTTLKLFSFVRGPLATRWDLSVLSHDGTETPFPWHELPDSFHFHAHVLRRFPTMSVAERQAACRAWAAGVRDSKPARLLVYRVQRRVSTTGGPGTLVRRDLRYECDVGP